MRDCSYCQAGWYEDSFFCYKLCCPCPTEKCHETDCNTCTMLGED